MKVNVDYNLDADLRCEIVKIRNVINNILKNCDIYIFGSIAKGKYSNDSDIDILVLIHEEKTLKDLRILRHYLEDQLEKESLIRDFDIKLYTKNRFEELALSPCFEQAILEDLIDLRSW